MRKLYCLICGKYVKCEKSKISYLLQETLVLFIRPWDKSKLLDILETKHLTYQKKVNLMQILKIDVNRHLPVTQSDNWHSFTGNVFLLLTKYQIMLWVSNRHKHKMFHYLST